MKQDEYFRSAKKGTCGLCGRTADLARHHLQPGKKHLIRGQERAWICYECHTEIHRLFKNKMLQNELDTLDKLKQQPELQKYINYIRKRKVKKIHQ